MGPALNDIRGNRRTILHAATAMFGAAAIDGCVEGFLPGDPPFSIATVLVVVAVFVALVAFGRWIPLRCLPLLGPLGVVLIAYALGTTPGPIDAAVLYALPVLWTSLFYGRRGAVAIVVFVGVAHAVALLSLPASSAYPGRWIDVMVSVTAIAIVVGALEQRNATLLRHLAGEARTDELTGLLNRRGFNERAEPAVAHARRESAPIALVAFDIDHFKCINDQSGHEAGDRVLERIGELLRSEARDIDVVARRGGEEFAALLPGSDAAGAAAFAERVRAALAASDSAPAPSARVSAGIAAGDGDDDLRELLEQADLALYEAKRAGRDRVVVFHSNAPMAG